MRTAFLITAAAMALAGCAARGAPTDMTQGEPATGCGLTITFGSYAMGIDMPTYNAVDALLAGDRAVTGVERRSWGREGERTLCVRTASTADSKRLYDAIGALLPAKPRGPVTVAMPGGKMRKAG